MGRRRRRVVLEEEDAPGSTSPKNTCCRRRADGLRLEQLLALAVLVKGGRVGAVREGEGVERERGGEGQLRARLGRDAAREEGLGRGSGRGGASDSTHFL